MTGLLLSNLGTPDQASPRAVRRYLREFLSDGRVLDLNRLGRWALVNLVILPWRTRTSTEAYRKIWSELGSPLLVHSQALALAVQQKLGSGWAVALGMRYQSPSLGSALAQLRAAGADRVVVFPLYPQYAAATTGSTVAEVLRLARRPWAPPSLDFVDSFYDRPSFIRALAAQGEAYVSGQRPDHVLFSFHGLPERHLQRTADADGSDRRCYRTQCYATARALAAELNLAEAGFSVAFQSRLGRTRWLEPHTDRRLAELAGQGCRRLVVFCPSFVADCLETLEEIGIRGRQQFLAAGGKELVLVPCLNASSVWVDAVVGLAREHADRA